MGWPLETVQYNQVKEVDVSSSDHVCNRWCVGLYIGEDCDLEVYMQAKPTDAFTYHGLKAGTILQGRFHTVLDDAGDSTPAGTDTILELILNRQPSVGGR